MNKLEKDISESFFYSVEGEMPSDNVKGNVFSSLQKEQEGTSYKRFKRRNSNMKVLRTAVSFTLIFAFVLSVNVFPAFAKYFEGIPVVSNIVEVIKIDKSLNKIMKNDKGIENAVKSGFGENVDKTSVDKGISFTVDSVVADEKRMIITYSVNVDSELGKNIESLWFYNMKVTDEKDNILVNIKKGTHDINGLEERSFAPMFMVGPGEPGEPEDLNEDNKSGKLSGWMELVKNKEGNKLPSKIKMTISDLKDTSPESTKGNKGDTIISGNWNVEFIIPDEIRNAKAIEYKGSNFNIEASNFNLDLKLDYVKIYPTTNALKIDVVNRHNSPRGGFNYKMHLTDENGRVYKHIGDGILTDTGNVLPEFESSYFTKPKELYLVIESIIAYDAETNKEKAIMVNKKVKIY